MNRIGRPPTLCGLSEAPTMATDLGFSAASRLFGMVVSKKKRFSRGGHSGEHRSSVVFPRRPPRPLRLISFAAMLLCRLEARQMTPAVLEKTRLHALACGHPRRC